MVYKDAQNTYLRDSKTRVYSGGCKRFRRIEHMYTCVYIDMCTCVYTIGSRSLYVYIYIIIYSYA